MPQRSIRAVLTLAIAFAMTLGMLLSSAHSVTSHNSYAVAQVEAHDAASKAGEVADHGHSHGDEGDDQRPGHVHGHNPGDHVHEPFGLTSISSPKQPCFESRIARPAAEASDLDLKSSLKRPPRPFVG